MKSRIPPGVFGLLDFPTFSTMQHLPCSNAQVMLASPILKAWLKQAFSFIVSKQSTEPGKLNKTEIQRNAIRHRIL